MDWKSLISDLQSKGLSQQAIGSLIGKSQAWVCAVAQGKYADLKWADGEALRSLHAERVASNGKEPEAA